MKIQPFEKKVWLSSPTMHDGDELKYVCISDKPDFERRGYMLDISRGKIAKVETVKDIVDYLEKNA